MSASSLTSGATSAEAIIAALRSQNASTLGLITKLKRKLTTKKNAVEFIDNNRVVFHAILKTIDRLINQPPPSTTDEQPSQYEGPLIRELVSVSANLCHLCFGGAVEIAKLMPNFTQTALKVLEAAAFDSATKTSMLRLLGNIAEYHETASLITHAPILLDRVVLMVNDEQPAISEAALRTVRILCKHRSYARSIVTTNGAYHIGLYFANKEIADILKDGNLLKIFDALHSSTLHMAVGRQLASGKCAPKFLEILLSEEKGKEMEKLQSMVLHFTKHSFDLREAFGRETIAQLVATQRKNRLICAVLSYFARDAWSRQALRTEFGLQMILERLDETDDLEEKGEIVSELRSYIHDQAGLRFICHRPELISVFTHLTNEYLIEKTENSNCAEDQTAIVEDHLETAVRGEFDTRSDALGRRRPEWARLSYRSDQRYDYTPPWYSRSPSSSLSPSTSPTRSADESWESASSAGGTNRSDEPFPSVERYRPSVQESIIDDAITIFAWITSGYNTTSDFLVKRETLDLFIRYLAEGPTINERLFKMLQRLIHTRLYLEKLLEIRFPLLVVVAMIRRECALQRFSPACRFCLERHRFGADIMNSFVQQADSAFGQGILDEEYALGGIRRTYALMHGIALIHHIERRNRFHARYDPINTLLKTFGETLVNRKDETKQEYDKLLLDIVISLSLLVSRRYFSKLIGPRSTDGHQEADGECPLRVPTPADPQMCVRRVDGSLLMSIRKEDVRATNSYFQGMLGHEIFVENQSNQVDFVFNPEVEACDEEDFVIFLHFLGDCRNTDCVRIEDAKTCAALLHLSDKYSCTELTEMLLASNGGVRRFMDGSNLLGFLPVCLSNWLIKDRLGSLLSIVFFKFSTDAQLVQIFDNLAGNQVAVDLFVELLTDFFKNVADCFRSSVLLPAWDFV